MQRYLLLFALTVHMGDTECVSGVAQMQTVIKGACGTMVEPK